MKHQHWADVILLVCLPDTVPLQLEILNWADTVYFVHHYLLHDSAARYMTVQYQVFPVPGKVTTLSGYARLLARLHFVSPANLIYLAE